MKNLKTVFIVFILSALSDLNAENFTEKKGFMLGAYYYAWYDAPKNEDDIGSVSYTHLTLPTKA